MIGLVPTVATNGRRASNKGALPMSFPKYLKLLDHVGRQVRGDKKGSIDDSLDSILSRIGISENGLLLTILDLMEKHSRYFSNTERDGRPDGSVDRDGYGREGFGQEGFTQAGPHSNSASDQSGNQNDSGGNEPVTISAR